MSSVNALHTRRAPIVPNSVLGMSIFILTEAMLFAAFISAYMIVSAGALNWPPLDQPRLPVISTAFNTIILLLSGLILFRSNQIHTREPASPLVKKLFFAALTLGSTFVLIQGFEWTRLIQYGLTMVSSVYGSFFYLIVGVHALHAIVALLALMIMYRRLKQDRLQKGSFVATQVFWYFVVLVWPVLYGLVYLN